MIWGLQQFIDWLKWKKGNSCTWFLEEVAIARCEVDKDPLKKQLGNIAKLKRNRFYGKMREDLGCHKSTKSIPDGLWTGPLDLHFLTFWKRLIGSMRPRSGSRDPSVGIPVYLLAKLRMSELL